MFQMSRQMRRKRLKTTGNLRNPQKMESLTLTHVGLMTDTSNSIQTILI